MFLSQLSLLLLLLYCLLFTTVVTGEGDCNGQYTEITVSKNGSDSNCTTSYKCATLQYVLTNVTLKNCTRISVHDNQTIDRLVTMKGINGLVIQGDVTTVTCSTKEISGIELVNCSDVQFMTIEWVNCEINSTLSDQSLHPSVQYVNVTILNCTINIFPAAFLTRQYMTTPYNLGTNHDEVIGVDNAMTFDYTFSPNCSSFNKTIKAMLGGNINDAQFDDIRGTVQYGCLIDGTLDLYESCDGMFELKGQRSPFSISGRQVSADEVKLVIMKPESTACLFVDLTDCYLGYVYDEGHNACVCYHGYEGEDVVVCLENTVCIKPGYWYGQINTDTTNTTYAASPCPFGYCNYAFNGSCPTQRCNTSVSAYQSYCELPENPNKLCSFDRGDVLCSGCKVNYSLSFDGGRCVSDDHCHKGYIALYIAITLLFWALIVSVILIVTKLDLRIGSGQLYCLVFFFSVLQYFVRGSFPSYFLYIVEMIFTGFMQLDPKMFGLLEICVFNGINNLQYAAFNCVNPLFLICMLGIMVYASRKWPKYVPFANNNGAVNMICIVLYLVFISLTQTSLAVLTPVRYPQAFVSLEPSVRYFDPSRHMPYALIALLVQLVLVLPFLSLLLFAPFLIKIGQLNLTRVKPLLDEYQACYKERYRSFAGYYLTCRQLIFLISLLPINMTSYIYILQILSILILTVHCLVQPYTSLQLNIVDGLLILDLVLLSILHGSTANVVFHNCMNLKIAIVHILVLLPVVYFIGICFLHFAQSTFLKDRDIWNYFKKKKHLRQTFTTQPTGDNEEPDSAVMEREPLLFESDLPRYDSTESGPLLISSGIVQIPRAVDVVQLTH